MLVPADNGDGMIGLLGTLGLIVDARLVMLENIAVCIHGGIQGTELADHVHNVLVGQLLGLAIHLDVHATQTIILYFGSLLLFSFALSDLYRINLVCNISYATFIYLVLVREFVFVGHSTILENVVESIDGSTSFASILASTVEQLLFTKVQIGVLVLVLDHVGTLQGGQRSKSPTTSTLALVFNRGNFSLVLPVKTFGQWTFVFDQTFPVDAFTFQTECPFGFVLVSSC